MDRFASSIARTCLSLSGIEKLYTDSVPSSFDVPSMYFPPPESVPVAGSLNSYHAEYVIFAHVYAKDRADAGELADGIVQGIMRMRCRLPLYNANGTDSGDIVKLNPPEARIVDEGVAQITLRDRVSYGFTEEAQTKTQDIDINKYYD